jgi:hypothetical protein
MLHVNLVVAAYSLDDDAGLFHGRQYAKHFKIGHCENQIGPLRAKQAITKLSDSPAGFLDSGRGYPPGMLSSKGSDWPSGGPFATWRTIEDDLLPPRTPSIVPRSKYLTAARIVTLASSSPAKSQSYSSDMTASA